MLSWFLIGILVGLFIRCTAKPHKSVEDKFKQKVIPGDILIFKLNLISPIRRGLCHMRGLGFVNNKIVVEADLLAQIAPKK